MWEKARKNQLKTTAVSCCGANPGMVSWLVKQALINLVKDTNYPIKE
jgi:homospermidine synthase